MKNIYILILILISFTSGFFVSKINFNDKVKNVDNSLSYNAEPKSGVYEQLVFENLKKIGDDYYIKFSKQEEDVPPTKECLEFKGITDSEDDPCPRTALLPREKLNPEIDLSKEYKVYRDNFNYGDVELIYYIYHNKDYFRESRELISVEKFFNLINNTEKLDIGYYYGGIIDNPERWSFNVTFVNGEVVLMSQIYQQ